MILVFAERSDEELFRQALAFARSLGDDDVLAVGIDDPAGYSPDAWGTALAGVTGDRRASVVVGPGTERGNEVLAHVAAMLDLPMAANCTSATSGDPLTLTRIRWGGSLLEEAQLHGSPGLLTVAPHAVAAESIELRDEGGFTGLKLRLGRDRLRDDLETIEAVRNAIGNDMALMIDFNRGLNLADALQRYHAIDDLGLTWIEEPIVYDNFDGFARLAAELKTPIQIGENFYGPRDVHTAIQKKACDFVMPDFMRIGGVTGWLRSAAIAGAAGIPVSTHLYPEVAAHVMRVTETAHWLEWQDWADPILLKPYDIKDGLLHIPNVPGVGLEWNEDAITSNAARF